MDVQRLGPPRSLWGTAIANQVMLESHVYRWDQNNPLFEFEIKFVACAIPKKLNPCCYDVLMQL